VGETGQLGALSERYVETLLWSLSALGVDESVERTVVAAVTIQFGVSVAQAGAPLLLPDGAVRVVAQGGLLLGAAVAFGNTVIVTRRNVTGPVERLRTVTEAVAAGDVPEMPVDADATVDTTQPDEIGDLARSVEEMRTALRTVEQQAEALAAREFDATALDRTVPGEFGTALDGMRTELRRYTRELETVLDRFGETADAAREGDLTARVDPSTVPPEYEMLARDFDDLLDALAASLREADRFATDVATATDEVGERARGLRETSETAAEAVDEIAAAADRQRQELATASEDVTDLSATVEEVAASAASVREQTSAADDLAETGRREATAAVEALRRAADQTASTTETVETLVAAVDEVGEIATVIEELAGRTNLLAINASIEAARAGGGGESAATTDAGGTGNAADGFAVVAREVQELSEAGQERAAEIQTTATELQQQADAAATAVTETQTAVTEAVERVEAALGRFDDLADAVATIDDAVAETEATTDEQSRVAAEIAGHVDEVAALAAETATDTETVAATAEQQAETADAVAADAAELSSDADRLSATFDRFRLHDASDSVSTPTVDD
jgi:methyl-accepting chemotaxis protein